MSKTLATKKDKLKVCKYCGMPVRNFLIQGNVVRFECGSREVNDSTRKSLGIRPKACEVIEVLSKGGTKLPKLESDQLEIQFPEVKITSRKLKSRLKASKVI